jgi:hypothetical protein
MARAVGERDEVMHGYQTKNKTTGMEEKRRAATGDRRNADG